MFMADFWDAVQGRAADHGRRRRRHCAFPFVAFRNSSADQQQRDKVIHVFKS
jgi:hypothetical protein